MTVRLLETNDEPLSQTANTPVEDFNTPLISRHTSWLNEVDEYKELGIDDTTIEELRLDILKEKREGGTSEEEIRRYFDTKQNTWAEDSKLLLEAGIPQENLNEYRQSMIEELEKAGAVPSTIRRYLGGQGINVEPIAKAVKAITHAEGVFEKFLAGLYGSSGHMAYSAITGGGIKNDLVDEDGSIASTLGRLAGDIPLMGVGAFLGGAAGAFGGPLVALGASGFGAGALPAVVRESILQCYDEGVIEDGRTFMDKFLTVLNETLKEGAIGAGSNLVGGKVGVTLASKGARAFAATLAKSGAEGLTGLGIDMAWEQRIPSKKEFLQVTALSLGVPVASGTVAQAQKKMALIYKKTGKRPLEVAEDMKQNPNIRETLLDGDPSSIPEVYEHLVDGPNNIKKETSILESDSPSKETDSPVRKVTLTPEEVSVLSILESEQPNKKLTLKESIDLKKEAIKNGIDYKLMQTYTDMVDRLHPIKKLQEKAGLNAETLTAEINPYKTARMVAGFGGKVKSFIEDGAFDPHTLERVGKSLNEIIEPFKKNNELKKFEAYMIAERAIELEGRQKISGVNLKEALKTVKDGRKKFGSAFKDIVEFQNHLLAYKYKSGLITPEKYNLAITENKSYIPFKRAIDDKKTTGFRKIKGSSKKIKDPIETILHNANESIRDAEINNAKRLTVDKIMEQGEDGILTRVETPHYILKDGEVEFYRDGVREVYRVADDIIGRDLIVESFKSIGSSSSVAASTLVRLARASTQIKKLAISVHPNFILNNFTRDLQGATILNKDISKFSHYKDWLGDLFYGMKSLIKKDDLYKEWLRSGGSNTYIFSKGADYVAHNIHGTGSRNVASPTNVVRLLEKLGEQSDAIARIARYRHARRVGASKQEAGFLSREATVDFARIGAKTTSLNLVTAFLNATIQGTDRVGRAIINDPKGVATRYSQTIGLATLLNWWSNKDDGRIDELPAWEKAMYHIVATDDWQPMDPFELEAYKKELDRANVNGQKIKNPVIRINSKGQYEINKGEITRIPIPHEFAVMKSFMERVLDFYLKDSPDAFSDFTSDMLGILAPSFIPDLAQPFIEKSFNHNFFTGKNLVPYHLERTYPVVQFTEYTSETAKGISKILAHIPSLNELNIKGAPVISPLVIDNFIRSWTGTTGADVIKTLDWGLKATGVAESRATSLTTYKDISIIKNFKVRFPHSRAESIEKFTKLFEENQAFKKTLNVIKKREEYEKLQKYMTGPERELGYVNFSGLYNAITTMKLGLSKMAEGDKYTDKEKKQLVTQTYFTMIALAKHGIDAYEAIKEAESKKENSKKIKPTTPIESEVIE